MSKVLGKEAETYSEPSRPAKMDFFAEIVLDDF